MNPFENGELLISALSSSNALWEILIDQWLNRASVFAINPLVEDWNKIKMGKIVYSREEIARLYN